MPCRLIYCVLATLFLLPGGCGTRPPAKATWEEWAQQPAGTIGPARPSARLMSIEPPAAEEPVELLAGYAPGDGAKVGQGFDLRMRNPGFPDTYIRRIYINVTSPNHWVHLEWAGPLAATAPAGPFRSNPGRGTGTNDCNNVEESNRSGSLCTPKGVFPVAGFADRLRTVRSCHYVTWVHLLRGVGLHSHNDVPDEPASHGCVRLDYDVAKLIHNNSRAGMTTIIIDGEWHWFDRGGL